MNLLRHRIEARLTATDLLNQDLAEVECAELTWNRTTQNRADMSVRRTAFFISPNDAAQPPLQAVGWSGWLTISLQPFPDP